MFSTRFSKPLATSALLAAIFPAAAPPRAVEIFRPAGGLPPQIVGQMREPAAFVQTSDGRYIVFDRRAHEIYGVDKAKTGIRKLVAIGQADGQILRPDVFAYNSANKTFVVVDAPGEYERVQTFYEDGTPIGRFQRWPPRAGAGRFSVNAVVFGGIGAIAPLGRHLIAAGHTSTELMSEMDGDGNAVGRIGRMRPTGHENDALLHHALNAGIPLVAPDGGIYFVFTTGVPMFRKYAATGELLFERHIEGPELDGAIQSLPTSWPTRKGPGNTEFPAVQTMVTTAAIDPHGDLWISLGVPFTYVYDAGGNKTRTLEFRGTELMSPASFFFTNDGRLLVTPGCYEFKPY
jgi:hypothetical protein